MKRLLLLLAVNALVFQPLLADTAKAQYTGDVKITLELKNETLKNAFEQIEKQTPFRFAYIKKEVDSHQNITLSVHDLTVDKTMELLLENTGLAFRQVNNKIIIFNSMNTPEPVYDEIKISDLLEDGTIKGRIVNEAAEPVPGASVSIGDEKGSAASAAGEFILSRVVPGSYKLRVSAVGYTTSVTDVTVTDGATVALVINLTAANNSMNEVIVTGYTRQSKRDVTGAVSTISADVVAKTPVADVASVLQGRVAGVTVDGQGGPGNNQVVRIRGVGTLGNNDPLYVIDGVQTTGGLNMINTNDIETITVLKDAANSALYGARGGNGVIVITTKRGKNGAPKLEYNGYAGYEVPKKLPQTMSPQQYADAYWDYLKNSGLTLNSPIYGNGATPVLPDYIIEKTSSPSFFGGVSANDPRIDPSLYNLNDYRIFKTNKTGTDWFDEVIGPAFVQSHQLALSGANEKSNYALTFNYLDNKGTLLYSYFKRYSIRVNTEFKVKPWLRFGENMQFSYGQQNTVADRADQKTDQNIIAGLYNTSPIMPVYDISGNFTGTKGATGLDGGNAVMSRANSKNFKGYNARLLGAVYGELEPIKGLIFQSKAALDYLPYQNSFIKNIIPQEQFDNGRNQFFESAGNSLEWRVTNKLSYEKTFGNHKINAFVAYEASKYTTRNLNGSNDSLFSLLQGFQYLGTGSPTTAKVGGSQDMLTYVSLFGNLNYIFADKYIASFTLRRDGSSKFGDLSRYGTFPSVSVGWRVSDEKFMQNVSWVQNLKLRAAVGNSGTEASLPGGATINQYGTNPSYFYYDLNGSNNASMQGFGLSQLGNPFLQWEVNKTTNLGFDAGFLNNRLNVSFSWYNRKTDKLLYQPPTTALQGDAFRRYENVMNFTNKGLELELAYTGRKSGKFSYDMNFNFSTYRNKVTYIDGDSASVILGDKYARVAPLSRSVVGRPISSFYGYIQEGIFQSAEEYTAAGVTQPGLTASTAAGHFRFRNENGKDNIINSDDQAFIGSPHPKFTFGYNLNLYYDKFDLGIFIQGVYGNKIMNYWRTFSAWPGKYGIGSLNTWSTTNTDATLPIYTSNTSTLDAQSSTFFIEDGSYVRIKNIQLGYTLPAIKGISKLRLYAQAYNVVTITNYSGMDPEVNTGQPGAMGIDFGGTYPIAMKFLFGVNLGL